MLMLPSPSIRPAAYARVGSCREQARDIFEKDIFGSDDFHDAMDFPEQVSNVSRTFAISGDAKRLARETCCDAIHSAGVVGWIEQPNVSLVHVQPWEPSIGGSITQDLAGVGVPLDGGNGRVPENEVTK